MSRREELTDEQWAVIGPLFPELAAREDGRGRPPTDPRTCEVKASSICPSASSTLPSSRRKGGAAPWAIPSGAKVRSSWRWQNALVFQSRSTRRLLARMKSLLSKTLSPKATLLLNLLN